MTWRFVLPHLSRHLAWPTQFIGNTVSVCVEDKTTNSAECFYIKELDFGIRVVQASNRAFRNERVRSTWSKRESTSMVACVEEDRVRLARSHCVLRHLCARGVLHVKCEPIVHEPTVSNGILHVAIYVLLLTHCQQISTSNRPNTLETPCC